MWGNIKFLTRVIRLFTIIFVFLQSDSVSLTKRFRKLVHFGSISHISYFDLHFYLEQRKYFSVGIIHF